MTMQGKNDYASHRKPCAISASMKINLTLEDLNPQDTLLKLSSHPEPILLERWSLYVRSWAMKRFGAEGLQRILREQIIEDVSELTWFMIKDKSLFPTHGDFMRAVVTQFDQIAVLTALLGAVGIGEPKLQEIRAAMKKASEKPDAPKRSAPVNKIGAKSSTRLPRATRGARRKDL